MQDVSNALEEEIPANIRVLLCERILLVRDDLKSFGDYAPNVAARLLGEIGGQQAGVILRKALFQKVYYSKHVRYHDLVAPAAVKALGTIEGYDPVPTLIEAGGFTNLPAADIAQALGKRNDTRAISALQEMASRRNLSESDRAWIAAALARLGADYNHNAAIVREALPASLEAAQWLHDAETIRAVAPFVDHRDQYTHQRAVRTLEAIGTDRAFETLIGFIKLDETIDPTRLQMLSSAAARTAEKLGRPSTDYYAEVAAVSQTVSGWFSIAQMQAPRAEQHSTFATVKRHPALARKLWIAEATRRLDLAAKQDREHHGSEIPEQAIRSVSDIFAPELIPALERITRESKAKVTFHGKYKMVDFYRLRSVTAEILSDKTGRQYTFADADGRTHPGGWDPSQDK